jgi:cytochrome bd-type quinol oxidase subunit 2
MKQFIQLAIGKINPGDIGLNNPATDANATVSNVLTVVYAWAGIICVLVIVIAGFLYTTSTANPSHTKRAREAIIYAVVGLVVVMLAFVITQFILGRF